MELIPLRFGYRLKIGTHDLLLTKKDLDELVELLTGHDGSMAKMAKIKYIKKQHLLAMNVGDYMVLNLSYQEFFRTRGTVQRCKRDGAEFDIQVVGGRKRYKDDPDRRDYLITRTS